MVECSQASVVMEAQMFKDGLALVVKTSCQDRNNTFPDGISTEYKDMQDCTVAQFLLVCRWRPCAAVA